MSRRESIYLDLLRSLAAFVVVLDHAPSLFHLPHLVRWGHQAVMLFFVLSGYVICHVADTRERTAYRFLVARLARLWSVLVPAMAITVLCDLIGRRYGLHADAYAMSPVDHQGVRVAAVLVFASECWISIQPLSNGVSWSMCVEFWYYLIFAAWAFVPTGRARFSTLATVMLLSGFKALLLLPVWLLGVSLERAEVLRRVPPWLAAALWAGSLVAIGWILATHIYDPVLAVSARLLKPWLFRQLAQARAFWFDWIFGGLVAAHLVGARLVSSRLPLESLERPVRWCAGVSFAAYLLHMPLLHLFAAFLGPDRGWLAIASTLGVIAVVGPPIERSKRAWRAGLAAVAMRLAPSRLA